MTVTSEDVARAADALRASELVAFPTETVYGLGADASSPTALARLYEVKGRPADHPVIVHLADVEEIGAWAVDVPDAALRLAVGCWPGPLTLVLPRAPGVLDAVTGGQDTVALRVPEQRVALELLRTFGGGVAAPSANRFGHVSPTTADHVRADLGADVAIVLDGGPCPVGVESTIVDCTRVPFRVLRLGKLGGEELAAIAGSPIESGVLRGGASGATDEPVRVPGALASHYAPRARVVVVDRDDRWSSVVEREVEGGNRVGVIVPDALVWNDELRSRVVALGAPSGSIPYARELYDMLRAADERDLDVVVARTPSGEDALAAAVIDRLRRAAAPRPDRAGHGT